MKLRVVFVGRAEPLAELYEGVGQPSFTLEDLAPFGKSSLTVPHTGDLVRLRMHPGPDIRTFRCIGRLFDFAVAGRQELCIQLDMPLHDAAVG